MADIRLAKPAAGASESVPCAPDARFVFDFPATDATLAREGDNLNISFQDGSQLQLQDFYKEYTEENLPSFNMDGTDVTAQDFFTAMNEPDLMPAAGPGTGTVANGARFHEWGDSALTGGIEHLNGLDWGFSRAFEWEDHPNAVGYTHDDDWAGGEAPVPAGPAAVATSPQPGPETPTILTVRPDIETETDGVHNIIIGHSPVANSDASGPQHLRLAFLLDASGNGSVKEIVGQADEHLAYKVKNSADTENPTGLLEYDDRTGQWAIVAKDGNSAEYFHYGYNGETKTPYYFFPDKGGAHTDDDGRVWATSFTRYDEIVNGKPVGEGVRCFISHWNEPAIYEYPVLSNSVEGIGDYIKAASAGLQPGEKLDILLEGFDVKVESYVTISIANEGGRISIEYHSCKASGYELEEISDGNYAVIDRDIYDHTTSSGAKDPLQGRVYLDEVLDKDSSYVDGGKITSFADFIDHILGDFTATVVYNIHSSWGYQKNFNYTAANYETALQLAHGWFASQEGEGANQAFLISDGGTSAHLKPATGEIKDLNFPTDFSKPLSVPSKDGGWKLVDNWADIHWTPGEHQLLMVGDTPLVINELGLVMGVKEIESEDDGVKYVASQLQMTAKVDDKTFDNVPVVMGFVPGKDGAPGYYAPHIIEGTFYNDHDETSYRVDSESYQNAFDAATALKAHDNNTTLTVVTNGLKDDENTEYLRDLATGEEYTKNLAGWSYAETSITNIIQDTRDTGADYLDGGTGDDVIFGDFLVADAGADYAKENEAALRDLAGSKDGSLEELAQAVRDNAEAIAAKIDADSGLTGGNDMLFGGEGNDVLFGMAGDDLLVGDGSRAELKGLTARDILDMDDRDKLAELGDIGKDGKGSDLLFGGGGDDVLIGGGGDDRLFGGAGRDVLLGGGGDDILVGGTHTETVCNLAFLVDTSAPNQLDTVKDQLNAAINGMKDMGQGVTINVMLMGFNSYASEVATLSWSDSTPEDFDLALENLSKEIHENFRKNGWKNSKIDDFDNTQGANYELAFNYASKWFADHSGEDAVNKTFVLAGQQPAGRIANDVRSGTNSIAGVYLDGRGTSSRLDVHIEGYDKGTGKLFLDGYEPGQKYDVHALYSDRTEEPHLLFTIDENGRAYFSEDYKWVWSWSEKEKEEKGDCSTWIKAKGQMVGLDPNPIELSDGNEYPMFAMWDADKGRWTLGYVVINSNAPDWADYMAGALDGYEALLTTCSDVTFIDFRAGETDHKQVDFSEFKDRSELEVKDLSGTVGDFVHSLTHSGDTLLGGDGDDILFGDELPDGYAPVGSADDIRADPGRFDFSSPEGGKAENDVLDGGAGDDILYGGAGNDFLFGGSGKDMLFGGSGDDFLHGGEDSDTLYGGSGDDLIVYDPTDYLIDGGDGIDFLLSDGSHGEREYSLARMLENYNNPDTDTNMPQVNGVEVMIKGVDLSLQNMKDLADKYGFTVKHENGRDILELKKGMWEEQTTEGPATEENGASRTTTYKFQGAGENGAEAGSESPITLETTLTADSTDSSTDTIVLTQLVANSQG